MLENEIIERPASQALNELLGKKIPVLDDGFVRVVDYMGTDSSIVQAARVSYGKGTSHVSKDRQLIRYLLRNSHTSPFEMCELKLHVRVPMDCWRQWIRHRTASVNEYSTRYSLAIDSAQGTSASDWRIQSEDNKQGSAGLIPEEQGHLLSDRERDLQRLSHEVYKERIDAGVAREQARKDLPLCTYTEAYWKTNLHNLMHFLALRMDPSAQQEIRAYADVIGDKIISAWVPLTWEAFCDYRRRSAYLSRVEVGLLGFVGQGDLKSACELALDEKWTRVDESGTLVKGREAREFEDKLQRMGLASPWAQNE